MRQIAITAASLALVAAPVMLAAPAQAAIVNVNVSDCASGTLNGQSFNVNAGDSLQITFGTCAAFSIASTSTGTFGANYSQGSATFGYLTPYFTATGPMGGALPAATYVVYFRNASAGTGTADGSFTINGGGTGGGGGSGASSSVQSGSTPVPVVQQFGRPTSGTCADAAPVTLNWGGASSGGWGESWAQWMNGGLGGAVCTRTLAYSTGTGMWGVAQ